MPFDPLNNNSGKFASFKQTDFKAGSVIVAVGRGCSVTTTVSLALHPLVASETSTMYFPDLFTEGVKLVLFKIVAVPN